MLAFCSALKKLILLPLGLRKILNTQLPVLKLAYVTFVMSNDLGNTRVVVL